MDAAGSSYDDIMKGRVVPRRRCPAGQDAPQPRHPRPAGADLEMIELYAADYGFVGVNNEMMSMDLRPMLDLVAALYAGCTTCIDEQVTAVAGNPYLTTHLVGVALCALMSLPAQPSPSLLLQKLDPHAAGIALVMRSQGLLTAANTALHMSYDNRKKAARAAAGCLVPTAWMGQPLSNFFEDGRLCAEGDAEMTASLSSDGYLSM